MRGHLAPRLVVLLQEKGCLEVGEGYRENGSTARVQIPREEMPRARRARRACRGGTILEDILGLEEPVAELQKRGLLQERWVTAREDVPRKSGYRM